MSRTSWLLWRARPVAAGGALMPYLSTLQVGERSTRLLGLAVAPVGTLNCSGASVADPNANAGEDGPGPRRRMAEEGARVGEWCGVRSAYDGCENSGCLKAGSGDCGGSTSGSGIGFRMPLRLALA